MYPKMPWQLTDIERAEIAHRDATIDDQTKIYRGSAVVADTTLMPDFAMDSDDLRKEPFAAADYVADPNAYKDKVAQAARDFGLDAAAASNVKGQ